MPARFSLNDAPSVIPIFPLPGALLLPRGRLPLNIFEPRYLVMIDEALKTEHRLIGMIQPKTEQGPKREIYSVGCAGRITTYSETDDGRYMIGLLGVCRFRVHEEIEGFQPYRQARVAFDPYQLDTKTPSNDCPDFDKADFLALVERYFRAKSFETDWDALKMADEETIVNALGMMCPFAPQEKQALLEAEDLTARRDVLHTLLTMDSAGEESSGGLQ